MAEMAGMASPDPDRLILKNLCHPWPEQRSKGSNQNE
jgi:hypothetical protein